MLRTAPTPLGRLWALVYRLIARAWLAYLAWGETGAAAYERAGLGRDDLLPGLSDVDVALVLREDPEGAGIAGERATDRWQRLRGRFPSADLLLDYPRIYEEPELTEAMGATALTYGLGGAGSGDTGRPMGYLAGAGVRADVVRILERPGLYGSTADWRLLKGPDRRPPEPSRDSQQQRIAGWLELAYCWRWAFLLCTVPTGPRSATLCVRTAAEPARIWLWLEHGERASSRTDALERARRHLPGETELDDALALHASLLKAPEPPEDRMLPALVGFSTRIAALIETQLESEGATQVRLAGARPAELIVSGGADPRALPLCDWRALVWPGMADESFLLSAAGPGDPRAIEAAAAREGSRAALEADGILVWPSDEGFRARMRAVHCRATDPVSFALAAGADTANFPNVSGWSAEDVARRSVAEHRAWLLQDPGSRGAPEGQAGALSRLFTAARAALFLESIRDGDPELPVTVAATAQGLSARSPAAAGVVEEALGSYRGWAAGGERPPSRTVGAMSALVSGLPPYA